MDARAGRMRYTPADVRVDSDREDETLFLSAGYISTLAIIDRRGRGLVDGIGLRRTQSHLYKYVNMSFHSCSTSRALTCQCVIPLGTGQLRRSRRDPRTHPCEFGLDLMNL